MKRYLLTTWFGVFVFDEKGKVLDHLLFPADPEGLSERLFAIDTGGIVEEEKEVVKKHPGVVGTDERHTALGIPVDPSAAEKNVFHVPEEIKKRYPPELLNRAAILMARKKTGKTPRDRLLIQAIRAYEDLVEIINNLYERLREWYGLHSYDLANRLSQKKLAEVVATYGDVREINMNTDIEGKVTGEVEPEDIRSIQSFARMLQEAIRESERLERYITRTMNEVAPNLSAVAGPLLGAKLISLAGGLDRLATMPSSTVQLLGAEPSLFIHLREGTPPPKHGVLFQHPLVHGAPRWQRGKIARVLAGKISIAARVDFVGNRFVGDALREEVDRRVEEIKKKYPEAPEKKKGVKKGGRKSVDKGDAKKSVKSVRRGKKRGGGGR